MTVAQASLTERVYVSQFSSPAFGLNIIKAGVPAQADAPPTVEVVQEGDPDVTLATLTSTQVEVGSYEVSLTSTHTQEPGFYTLKWDYTFEGYIEVGPANPCYP